MSKLLDPERKDKEGSGENKQAFTKKYVLYSFGFEIILPYERTVVTSGMQFTKTLQAQ